MVNININVRHYFTLEDIILRKFFCLVMCLFVFAFFQLKSFKGSTISSKGLDYIDSFYSGQAVMVFSDWKKNFEEFVVFVNEIKTVHGYNPPKMVFEICVIGVIVNFIMFKEFDFHTNI